MGLTRHTRQRVLSAVVLGIAMTCLVSGQQSAAARERTSGEGHRLTTTVPLDQATASVAFSPNGDGEKLIVAAVDDARRSVRVQAYGFTDRAILAALKRAHTRGVDVRIILDKSNDTARYSGATYVAHAGIPVSIDYKPAIAHNKVMIIDANVVITGSFNFTSSAQTRNAENVLVLHNAPDLAKAYQRNWDRRLSQSRPYRSR